MLSRGMRRPPPRQPFSPQTFRYNSKDGREAGISATDSLGGLLSESANESAPYSYTCDEFSRAAEILSAGGLQKVYTYDSGDRVTGLKVCQGSALEMDLVCEKGEYAKNAANKVLEGLKMSHWKIK